MKIPRKEIKQSSNYKLIANGTPIKCDGKVSMKISLGNRAEWTYVLISNNQKDMLLSWKLCQQLGIIHDNFPEQIKCDDTTHIRVLKLEEQREKMQKKLLEEYKDVFADTDDSLKTMKGPPMKIHLDEENVQPYAIHTARAIPFAWKDEVKKTLDDMVRKEIIKPMDNKPSEWCHPMVVVGKSTGVRICVDLTMLNKYVKRPVYPTTTSKEAITNIPEGMQYFSTLDARHGYWQVALDEESQEMTTFITPWGRFCFLRPPMGLSATGDEYCRQGSEAMANLENTQKVVDDVIIYNQDFESYYENVVNFLEVCRKQNMTLNPEKFCFAKREVKYAGYQVKRDGITIDPEKVKAVSKFPKPTNITELRSFMGLVNQFGDFSHEISKTEAPLRELLSNNKVYINDYQFRVKHLKQRKSL